MIRAEGIEIHTSNPDQFGQYLLTTYHDSHGTTRTIAWRQDPADTWGPPHVLFPAEIPVPRVPTDGGFDEKRAGEVAS